MAPSLTGRLLVAGPHLLDPNFARSVVLICRHDAEGALGLILNRRTDSPVAEHLPGWTETLDAPGVVFVGGPVQPETAIGLARRRAGAAVDDWLEVVGDLGLIDLGADPAAQVGRIEHLRVFSGYAGWTAGQLDFEAASEDWFVVDADDTDPFTPEPEGMWRRVLRRQPGSLPLYADFPLDPSGN
jgi:putative transcriptional regulator